VSPCTCRYVSGRRLNLHLAAISKAAREGGLRKAAYENAVSELRLANQPEISKIDTTGRSSVLC